MLKEIYAMCPSEGKTNNFHRGSIEEQIYEALWDLRDSLPEDAYNCGVAAAVALMFEGLVCQQASWQFVKMMLWFLNTAFKKERKQR